MNVLICAFNACDKSTIKSAFTSENWIRYFFASFEYYNMVSMYVTFDWSIGRALAAANVDEKSGWNRLLLNL